MPPVVFSCGDLDETYNSLAAKGGDFKQGLTKTAWGSFAIFTDPDSNELILTQND